MPKRHLRGAVVRLTVVAICTFWPQLVARADAQTLPSGWSARDIGAWRAGSTQHTGGTYTLKGAGDVAGTADQFHFAYRQVTGDIEIRARVVSIENVHPWSRAGVMMRETLAANAAFGMMLISGSSGSAFHKRLSTGASRVSTAGTVVAAPYWVRLERRGASVTASQSRDGVAWTTIGTMTMSQPTMYVGLAVASADASRLATGVLDNVRVQAPVASGWNQPPTVSLTAPANGATYTAPASIPLAATASDVNGTIARVDFFAGPTLLATDWVTPYTYTWTGAAAGSYAITAVARDNGGATTTSAVRTVTVSTATTGSLPAGWTARDVGSPWRTGSTQHTGGTYTLKGAGDVAGTADQFHFAYRQVTGDIEIRARVVSIENVHPWSKAGVMMRETLAANAAFGMMLISGSSGSAFHKRLSTGASRVSTPGTVVAAPYWVRLERRGAIVTAFQSRDGVAWTTIGTMTMSQPTMYVGLAVASADASRLATGVLDNVRVQAPAAPAWNQPPTVSLTAPANGATYTAPASIPLAATASDVNGTIARVDFFAGPTLLATDWVTPYTYTWTGAAAGSYAITAVARDNGGAATTSAVRTVTVSTSSTNQFPLVSLTAPLAGTVYTAPATVPIIASASDSDGSIARVEFYAGTALIGSDTTAPYATSWSNVPAGLYWLTAVARDNAGGMTVSGARDIRVDSAQLPRRAIFVPSINHATAVERYFLEIFPLGADPRVANPVATQDLGKPPVVGGECTADISLATVGLAPGIYIATVTAIGSGGTSQSAASASFVR